MKFRGLVLSKRLLIPATAVAIILLLFFNLTRDSATVSGPSAIIDFFNGETSSIIILDTPKSRHTILWISEGI